MGINYYVMIGKTELHIGKSSIGWQFLFQGYKGYGLDSKIEWLHYLSKYRKNIYDEDNVKVSFDEIRELIERKSPKDEKLLNHYDECVKSNYNIEETIKDDDGYTIIFNEFK